MPASLCEGCRGTGRDLGSDNPLRDGNPVLVCRDCGGTGAPPASITQAIHRAETVEALLDARYTDRIASPRIRVSKREARRIVAMAPKAQQPKALWEGSNLLLMPQVSDDYDTC